MVTLLSFLLLVLRRYDGFGISNPSALHVRSVGQEIGVGGGTQLFKTTVRFQRVTRFQHKVLSRDLCHQMDQVRKSHTSLKALP